MTAPPKPVDPITHFAYQTKYAAGVTALLTVALAVKDEHHSGISAARLAKDLIEESGMSEEQVAWSNEAASVLVEMMEDQTEQWFREQFPNQKAA